MILRTDSLEDMEQLVSYFREYKYVLSSGLVSEAYYSQGTIWLSPGNNVIDNLDGKTHIVGEDTWGIVINKNI